MAKKPACSRFLRRNGQTQKPKRFRHTGGETTAEQFLVSSPVQGKAPIHAVKRYEILEMPSARIIAQDDADSFYSFGPFRLDPRSLVLTKDGLRVPLTSKATEVLLAARRKERDDCSEGGVTRGGLGRIPSRRQQFEPVRFCDSQGTWGTPR